MKHIFLINSFTIGKKSELLIQRINSVCKNNSIDYIIEIINDKNSTEEISDKYKDSENIILAVGGDGTINRVLNKIVGTKNILGFIPYGTGNDLYKSALRQCKDLFNTVDIVKINEKHFINVACFGIDADVGNNSKIIKSKLIPKKQRYNIGVIYSFIKYKGRNFEVIVDKEKINNKFTTIVVCNGMFYGNGYNIAPSSELNNGKLDIFLAPNLNKLNMLKLILSMKKGKHEASDKIRKIESESITIKSDMNVISNVDGEELESGEFNIKIIKSGITLYFNKQLIDEILKK